MARPRNAAHISSNRFVGRSRETVDRARNNKVLTAGVAVAGASAGVGAGEGVDAATTAASAWAGDGA